MKYIINGRFLAQTLTGVQRYAREIVSELDKICRGSDIEIAVPSDVQENPPYENIRIVRIGGKSGVVWEQTAFSRYVRKNRAVSVDLCNSAPLRGKKIVAVHDVKVKAHPEFFSLKFRAWYSFLFRNICKRAQALITVSEFSKQEIIKYYGVPSGKISVVYNAWQHYAPVPADPSVMEKFGVSRQGYFFALGSLDPNKNLKWILKAARRLPQEIFLIGGGINQSVFAKQDLCLPGNVRLTGYLSDPEAKALMQGCKAFLFPSFYEGFGIPPMEAMVAGAPRIIVSDIPVLHEIFGDAVEYLDPNKDEAQLLSVCGGACSEAGYERILSKFSWRDSAEKLLQVLRSMEEG